MGKKKKENKCAGRQTEKSQNKKLAIQSYVSLLAH